MVLISEFKAKCIRLIKEVHETGRPLTVSLRGKPMVRVEPISRPTSGGRLGRLRGQIVIKTDIVHADFSADWD